MEPEIITRSLVKIIGVQYRGDFHASKRCSDIWGRFAERYEEVKGSAKQPVFPYGVHTGIDLENRVCDHTAGIEVANIDIVPNDMVLLEIPEQHYAVFESRFASIMETLMSYKDFWKQSGYRRSGGPELLQFNTPYDICFNPHRTDATVSVYIPIDR